MKIERSNPMEVLELKTTVTKTRKTLPEWRHSPADTQGNSELKDRTLFQIHSGQQREENGLENKGTELPGYVVLYQKI